MTAEISLLNLAGTASHNWHDLTVLTGGTTAPKAASFLIKQAETNAEVESYRQIRREVFVAEQGLFAGSDLDDQDDDPRTVVLVAMSPEGTVLGGVRLAPSTPTLDLGWWSGSRLVVAKTARKAGGIGAALVRAASAYAEEHGVLRFEATVQSQNEILFRRLGWKKVNQVTVAGYPHVHMLWPIGRFQKLADRNKSMLGRLLGNGHVGQPDGDRKILDGRAFLGDDGAPVPGTNIIAACDAILPSMVERDPEWSGWCSILVNMNDLSAMGAEGLGLLDSLGARDESFAHRVFKGLKMASEAWQIPVLGGHTQIGVPASLSVTAIGRANRPVPGGGGKVGHRLSVSADLTGDWRPGYRGSQWDSSSTRSSGELMELGSMVRKAQPAAAKDISMVGIVGTAGMLAEASGCGAVLDIDSIPKPGSARMGDWLSCFPGFAMITSDEPQQGRMHSPLTTTAECGELVQGTGVQIRWPDGLITEAISDGITGLGSTRQ